MIKVSNQFYKIWFAWKQVLMNIPYAFMVLITLHELASEWLFYKVTGRDWTYVCLMKRRLVERKDRKITRGL